MNTNPKLLALLLAFVPAAAAAQDRPRVEAWTTHGDAVYTRGQYARVYVRTDRDAYLTVLRVDTDGRVRVLFPHDPWEDSFARAGRDYEITGTGGREAFRVDDYPGVGYIFAVASADPFDYRAVVTGDHWDYRAIAAGRVRGDPYVALTDFVQQVTPAGATAWDYDMVPYYVEQHYDYPRFLCYDCHTYTSYIGWNPYHYSCVRFRIVIYDAPWYYPYRYRGGRRAVFVRPYRPEPRFIFKDRKPSDNYVSRVQDRERERPVNDNTRRGVRARDLGGIGTIPPPRQRPANEVRPGQANQPSRVDRPDQPSRANRSDRPNQPGGRDQPNRSDRPQGSPGEGRREPPRAAPTERDAPRATPDRGRGEPQPRAAPDRGRQEPKPRAAPDRGRAEPKPRAAPDRGHAEPKPRAAPDRGRAEPKPRAEPRNSGGSRGEPERSKPELKRRRS